MMQRSVINRLSRVYACVHSAEKTLLDDRLTTRATYAVQWQVVVGYLIMPLRPRSRNRHRAIRTPVRTIASTPPPRAVVFLA